MLLIGGYTDKGQRRNRNEDAYAIVAGEAACIVADGVGGNHAGEIASQTAVAIASEFMSVNRLSEKEQEQLPAFFDECLAKANEDVIEIAAEFPENKGMATTMVICHVRDDKAFFANVGDSRGYLCRDSELIQITEDHSYVNALRQLGVLTEEQAKAHESGNVITRAIGAESVVEADHFQVSVQKGDTLLLCTDGLYGEVSKEEIIFILETEDNPEEMCRRLIDAANKHGGRDNITAVAIRYMGGPDHE